jgi:hypothetical protein
MMMREKLKWVAASVLVGGGIAAAAVAQQTSNQGRPASEPSRAATKAIAPTSENGPADARWVRTLSSGARIKVVGISTHPSGLTTWWRPDGTPLAQPPCDPSQDSVTPDPAEDRVVRAVVVQLANVPAGAEHHWSIDESAGGAGGSPQRGRKAVPGLSQWITDFPRRLKTSTVRFEVATGPWVTVQTCGNSPSSRGTKNGPNYIFSRAIATKEGAMLSVTHDLSDVSVRLVAVDRKGNGHVAEVRSGGGVQGYHQLVVEFDLPPEKIEEFRVQTRHFERVEIPGVALNPAGGD